MRKSTKALVAAVATLSMLAAGCSSATGDDTAAAVGGDSVIEHQYGSTEVPPNPQRVVALGLGDIDTILALGVTPITVSPWGSGSIVNEAGVGPWAEDALGDARPTVIDTGSDGVGSAIVEQVAAAQPDLIIAVNNVVDRNAYEQLSQIAPTVVRPADYADWSVPWEVSTQMIGDAIGKGEQATKLIAQTTDLFTQARAQNPEFSTRTGAVMLMNATGGYYVYGPGDGRGQTLASLGFTLPVDVESLIADGKFYADISAENAELLNVDTLVVLDYDDAQAKLAADPLFQALDVVRDGRVVYVDQPLGSAMSMPNALSIPFALDQLVPQLAAAK